MDFFFKLRRVNRVVLMGYLPYVLCNRGCCAETVGNIIFYYSSGVTGWLFGFFFFENDFFAETFAPIACTVTIRIHIMTYYYILRNVLYYIVVWTYKDSLVVAAPLPPTYHPCSCRGSRDVADAARPRDIYYFVAKRCVVLRILNLSYNHERYKRTHRTNSLLTQKVSLGWVTPMI